MIIMLEVLKKASYLGTLKQKIKIMITTFLVALVPMVVGFIWYNPKVLGNLWMRETGLTQEFLMKDFNPLKTYGIAYLFSVLLAIALSHFGITIHQNGLDSLMAPHADLTPELKAQIEALKTASGGMYRSFKHGLLHGTIAALFIALPILGMNALFERRSFKYILVHLGFWVINLALMCGIICQWA
jgi:hypothetical protein